MSYSTGKTTIIAVDVMGGDYAPQEAVQGALAAAKDFLKL